MVPLPLHMGGYYKRILKSRAFALLFVLWYFRDVDKHRPLLLQIFQYDAPFFGEFIEGE